MSTRKFEVNELTLRVLTALIADPGVLQSLSPKIRESIIENPYSIVRKLMPERDALKYLGVVTIPPAKGKFVIKDCKIFDITSEGEFPLVYFYDKDKIQFFTSLLGDTEIEYSTQEMKLCYSRIVKRWISKDRVLKEIGDPVYAPLSLVDALVLMKSGDQCVPRSAVDQSKINQHNFFVSGEKGNGRYLEEDGLYTFQTEIMSYQSERPSFFFHSGLHAGRLFTNNFVFLNPTPRISV